MGVSTAKFKDSVIFKHIETAAAACLVSYVLGHVCFLLLPLLSCTDLTCHMYDNQPRAGYRGGPIKHNYCEHEAFLPTVKRFCLFSHFQSNFMAKNYPSFTTLMFLLERLLTI